MTSEQQIAAFIDKFAPSIAVLVRSCRAALHQRFPTAFELIYDNYNALAIGYAATERTSDCIVSLAIYPNSVALSFYYGASLPDPHHRLEGSGKQSRFIRLAGPDTLSDPAIEALIAAAITQSKHSPPVTGSVTTIVKSVSLKQRPRRTPVASTEKLSAN